MLRFFHAHFVRRNRQHQRGFHVATVHTEALLVRVKGLQSLAQGQLVPVAAEDGQTAVTPQLPRHHVHQAHIAAVRIKEQEFFQARPRHRFPQTAPLLDDRGGREAHRAVIRQML